MEPIRWNNLYNETELYKACLRVYTKSLFSWRKALAVSTDQNTLYDFAQRGLHNLDALHKSLSERRFHFRPGVALRRRCGKKARTIYLFPWEERIVDLLLYRLLSQALRRWFSPNAYAYRSGGAGLDRRRRRIPGQLRDGRRSRLQS
ncbi:MAG: hypothetical protein HY611_01820 [Elusimicrobia bacterium]|nr:hypothetical protein [Elusimicrobiota bacterium]